MRQFRLVSLRSTSNFLIKLISLLNMNIFKSPRKNLHTKFTLLNLKFKIELTLKLHTLTKVSTEANKNVKNTFVIY